MGLFGKSKQERLAERQREELLSTAFSHREIRLGRSKHYDNERKAWRLQRRVDGQWIDDGPMVAADWRRRQQEWLDNAPNDPDFDADWANGVEMFELGNKLGEAMYVEASRRAGRRP